MPLPRGPIMDVLWKAHRALWDVSGGRLGARTSGLPVAELTTTGRASGEPRSALIHYLAHGDAFVVIGSNVGRDKPPAWALNPQANPRARLRTAGREVGVTARVATGEEREALWRLASTEKTDYAAYQERTDRELPVFVLEPTGAPTEPRP